MTGQFCIRGKISTYLAGTFALLALYLISRYNYLLFHSLVEFFSVAIAAGIFMFAWNSRRFIANNYLVFIGISYLFVGTIDLLHTLSYKNMGVFPGGGANLPTQLWIAGRYLQSCSLVAAPLLLNRQLNFRLIFTGFCAVTSLLLLSIFTWGVFPDCFVDGEGLTPFKRVSEYIISVLLAFSLLYMLRKRQTFHRDVVSLLASSIILLIIAELSFTLYTDVYGISNMIGHLFKSISFYLIYKAMIETGLSRPLDIMFRELQQSNDLLEQRVKERTAELNDSITLLREEIIERKLTEEKLLKSSVEIRQSREMIGRLNRLYALLSATNQAIVHTEDRDSLFRAFCRAAVEHGGFRLAWVGLVDRESGLLDVAACHGATGYLEDIRISVGDDAGSVGPTVMAFREGTYYICNDFHNSRITGPWHDRARSFGLYSSASVAVRQNNEVIGALTLYAGEKDFFDSRQVELLREMGADVSFALDNLERRETLRQKDRLLIQQSRQAAMGEMINNIAHQWRQPLNGLGLIVQTVPLMYETKGFTREYLETMQEKAMNLISHMSQTIEDFRNYFRPDKEPVFFSVAEAVSKALTLVGESFRNQRIAIRIETEDVPPIKGYRNEYSQVLLNILNNARDALAEGRTDDPRVVITTRMENGKTVVTISDNGGGIPEHLIDRIFEPYFTTKGADAGTGVGLYMSKTIIEQSMNGRLTARNTADGAEFMVEV